MNSVRPSPEQVAAGCQSGEKRADGNRYGVNIGADHKSELLDPERLIHQRRRRTRTEHPPPSPHRNWVLAFEASKQRRQHRRRLTDDDGAWMASTRSGNEHATDTKARRAFFG